ncbi:hypothetical protein BV25DRAFT_1893853 [Artomyces pyxidatus]|uniref:Uncharacterized protein n=1 Tax=Artomyces pyxidatus TaxID=48021 RepID=A0ACB8SJU7_9AGAM|nr:hypothetical protein BV25DRAFT_1893853 [Artomyces pyxidatus]
MDEVQALEALSNLLTELAENPYDITLHAQHINLASAAGMDDQVHSAREMMTNYWAAGEEVWIPYIEVKKKSVDLDTLEGAQEILDVYTRAEQDYLSIPLLLQHVEFLIDRHAHFASLESKPTEEEPFSTQWTHDNLSFVVSKGLKHLTEGYRLWEAQRDWEFEALDAAPAEEKPLLVLNIEQLHLDRLEQPHFNHEETFQSYSSFTTNHKPPTEYETLLVEASKIRAKASKQYDWREPYETRLAQAGNSLAAYDHYVKYERRSRKPDLSVVSGVYERAIAEAAKRRFVGEEGSEEMLRSFWDSYIDALRIYSAEKDEQHSVLQRALRSVPGSGEIWAQYIRFLEGFTSGLDDESQYETVASVYDRAFATKLLQKDPEQIVPVVLSRAGYEHRRIQAQGPTDDAAQDIYSLLESGIKLVRTASQTGDPRFRLEKFLVEILLHAENNDRAADVWGRTARHYKTNYFPWIEHAETLKRDEEHESARKVFAHAATAKLDWPEAVWEAWIAFEHAHGTVETIQECLDTVQRVRGQVNARRAKEAEQASYQAMQMAMEQQAAQVPAAEAVGAAQPQEVHMEVDSEAQVTQTGVKRKAEDSLAVEDTKKAKIETVQHLKRDRENCTVFVGELPSEASDDDLRQLFKDCGSIREIKMTSLPNALVATVEFMERDSVPAALTKDKKRLHEHEIAVHMAWQSTLYVTNFPEKADDASMRELFGKYGLIFDVRWPSKKFKSTRRFCYVQYVSPNSAKAALELHGQELESGLPLNVYISNPERKKERTDADANAKEVYVAGLSKFATKEDLENLFKTYGPVKDVRMALDAENHSKGFAFIEFEEEKDAVTALNANNYELKKRRIAVTLADTRVKGRKRESESGMGKKADTRNRSLRIRGLPSGTSEGLLQQALEKYAPIKRVEVFEDKHEAVAEFQTPADAAKLLLLPDPVVFNGTQLKLSENEDRPGAARAAPAPTGGMFVPRHAASRPRAGLGHVRKPAVVPNATVSSSSAVADQSGPRQGKAQDDFRKMLAGGK